MQGYGGMMPNAEAESDGMTVDETNTNNNCSSSDNRIGEDDNTKKKQNQAWGTWEELLLACAVKRHGFRNWDSVSMEVQSRSSLPCLLTTAQNCEQKFQDLKRRFQEQTTTEDGDDVAEEDWEDKVDTVPWMEHLRSLRVAELRRELKLYDVSISSLQLKVKKLEAESDQSVGVQKPDLDDDSKEDRSENDGTEQTRSIREKAISAAEESDRENRSINESNTTASGEKSAAGEDKLGADEAVEAREESMNPDPYPVDKAAGTEEGSFSRGSEVSRSGELGESGTSTGFGRTWKRKGRTSRRGKENLGDGMKWSEGKSERLVGFLDMIRSHPHGSLFQRRLRSQETKNYKSLVRKHMDFETIQTKLERGSYSSSSSSALSFFRDLHLLFSNAIVFFPPSSTESITAHKLRTLVSTMIKGKCGNSNLTTIRPRGDNTSSSIKLEPETSDSSLSRQKSAAPALIVCKRRNSVSPSSSFSKKAEKISEETSGDKEKMLTTGVRSSRRTNKGVSKKTSSPTSNKQETSKHEKKAIIASDKKKSVADFLKRIKNSPGNTPEKKGSRGKEESKRDTKGKERELRSNTKEKKKAEEDNNTPLKRRQERKKVAETVASPRKRNRETASSSGKDIKQPKKRSRR